MNATIIVAILRAIFCNENLKAWLENQALVTDSPLDNMAVKIIYLLLACDKEK